MSNKKQYRYVQVSSLPVEHFDGKNGDTLVTSLTALATQYELAYLLSHHDDGVVWGRFENEGWTFSAEKFAISPEFSPETLQECRVFGETAELFIWRNGNNTLQASLLLEDENSKQMKCFDQQQLLWGDTSEQQRDNFTILAESSQGLRHAVPINVYLNRNQYPPHRVALKVRHYIAYDNHQAYVKWSRLTGIKQVTVGNIGRSS
ncbi:MAG: TIGR03984 family CRISPR-associated protein [Anaerolineales bacterium]|nr:TIGR03984 family CRISPR-associated protein [Anaerolineales bacterium]